MKTAINKIESKYAQLISSNNSYGLISKKSDIQELFNQAKLRSYEIGIIKIGSMLINIFLTCTEYTKAIELSEELMKYAENIKDYHTQIYLYKSMGYAYFSLGNESIAIEKFEKALTIISFSNIRATLSDILKYLIKIYTNKEDYKQANKYLRQQLNEKIRQLENLNTQRLDNIILENELSKEKTNHDLIRLQTKELQKKSIALEKSMIAIQRLNDIGKYINSTLNLNEIISRIYYSNIEYLCIDFFSISVLNEDKSELTCYSYHKNSNINKVYKDYQGLKTEISWSILNKREIFVSNKSDLLEYTVKNDIKNILYHERELTKYKNNQIESLYTIPLIFEKKVLGAISFKSLSPNAFNNEKREYIKALSTYTAIAINNFKKTDILKNKINERVQIEEVLINVNKDLVVLSSVDALSGVGNRRELELKLQTVVYKQKTLKSTLSLLMIDIDKFKDYNDYYGHQEGDECIKTVANTLKSLINDTDFFVGRYGGEEFVIILHSVDKQQTLDFAENLRKSIAELKIEHRKSDFGIVTVSVGCTICIPDNNTQYEGIIEIADNALYKAKYAGRNQVFFIDYPKD